jgi:hypothetical protein
MEPGVKLAGSRTTVLVALCLVGAGVQQPVLHWRP